MNNIFPLPEGHIAGLGLDVEQAISSSSHSVDEWSLNKSIVLDVIALLPAIGGAVVPQLETFGHEE